MKISDQTFRNQLAFSTKKEKSYRATIHKKGEDDGVLLQVLREN